ncbi:Mpv17 / PMP22 family domain containing protein [Tylopilus felleus]
MASFFRIYNAALIQRPMLAQSATAAFLFGAGDIIAQQAIEHEGKNHDFMRTARLAFYGGALFGPALTKWFQLLDRIKFASPTRGVIYRVWLDQALLAPVAVGFFFGTMSILEGKGTSGAVERINENYQPTLIRNWCVFIPTQIINFAVVPHHLRFGVVSVVSLFWNTYLSSVNAHTHHEEKDKHTE